jgi:hypothetical protein
MTSLGRGRRNTLSLFAVLDTAAGEVIGRCFARHRAREFQAPRSSNWPACIPA